MKELWDFFSRLRAATYSRVTVEMLYVDMVDDLNSGILLSQLIYWYLPATSGISKLKVFKDGEYWVSKSYGEWFEEVRLKKRQVMRAAGILEKKGLIKTKVFRFNGAPTVHYQLNTEGFITLLTTELKNLGKTNGKNSDSAESVLSIVQKVYDGKYTNGTIDSAESARSLTETTTETTHNKKKRIKTENSGKKNQEREAINLKLKHFTPKTQREILRCLSGFEVNDKIKKITDDIFNNSLKEATL